VTQRQRIPSGYHFVEGPPAMADYLALRQRAGLSPRRADQASAAVQGSWAAVHVVHDQTGDTVGMGRVLGDGGWYFHIADMAVLPEHQRRGLGDAILGALLDAIGHRAPAGAYVSLLADPPGRPLYKRHGFRETAPQSVGMARMLE
jgi:ribosomal protein S18 acetylase RimI-like enzyme